MIERKQAQEDRSFLAAIVDSSDDAIIGKTLDGIITIWNRSAQELYGYSAEEAVGEPISILAPPECSDEVPRILEKVRQGEKIERYETVLMTKAGRRLDISLTMSPINGSEGNVVGASTITHNITEHKEAEEALKESERRFSTLLSNAPAMVYRCMNEPGWPLQFVSSYATELTGYAAPDFTNNVGLEYGDLILEEERGRVWDEVQAALGMHERFKISYPIRHKDGTIRHVEEVGQGIYDQDGDVLAIEGFVTDVTERNRTDEALRQSEERYRSLVELSPDAILVHSKGKLVYVNTTGARLLGAALPDELIGKPALDLIHPDYQEIAKERVRLVLTQRKKIDPIEEKILCLDGRVMDAEVSGSFIIYQGKPAVQNVIRDITERKEAEKEKVRQARYTALRADVNAALAKGGTLHSILRRCTQAIVRHLDAAFARIWSLDEEENVLELQASAGMYTHLDGEHSRVPVGKFKIGHIAQEQLPHLTNDVLNDPRIHDKEWARREGMIAFAGYPLIIEDRLVGVAAIFAREQLAEAALNALASVTDTIAQGIVRKRTEENLKAYAARLNQSNRELQDFAYVASHDLQEPLRKVRTFSDRLNAKYGEVLGEQGRDYLERMEGAAARMQNLIDGLLTLARVTTRAQPFTSVDLNELARDVVSDLEARIDQVGGRVEVSGLPTIEADRLQMRQLLQNLIGNAIKFHREKEAPPVVKVYGRLLQRRQEELSEGPADSRICQILVEDNGIGFDEKHLERVFAPFDRLHSRAVYEGTGMGLPICRKVVERHGGAITAKSAPGQGATFVVTLPIKQAKGNL